MSVNRMSLGEVHHSSIRAETAKLHVTQMFGSQYLRYTTFSFFMIEELPPPSVYILISRTLFSLGLPHIL